MEGDRTTSSCSERLRSGRYKQALRASLSLGYPVLAALPREPVRPLSTMTVCKLSQIKTPWHDRRAEAEKLLEAERDAGSPLGTSSEHRKFFRRPSRRMHEPSFGNGR